MNMETLQKKVYIANDVWAASAAAFRVNNGYVRRNTDDKSRKANHILLRSFVTKPENLLDEDRALGEKVRDHYKQLLFEFIAESLRDYLKQAHLASMLEEIPASGTDSTKLLALIATLPGSYTGEIKRKSDRLKLDSVIVNSQIVGIAGQSYSSKVTVVDAIFKPRYGSYAVNVKDENNNVMFFFTYEKFIVGQDVTINAVVKAHHGQTTQIERVRLKKD